MSLIYYAVNGEGRGHATRARTLIEELRKHHRVIVYAYAQSYEFLNSMYRLTEVEIRPTENLRWHYDSKGKVSPIKTIVYAAPYLATLTTRVDKVVRDMERDKPDLVITDFEPIVPRAAEKVGIPYISVDHQHFLRVHDFSELPLKLRAYIALMGSVVKHYYSNQTETVVSSFFAPPLKKKYNNVVQVGTLIRPEVTNVMPEEGEHAVAYLRRSSVRNNVLNMLERCYPKAIVYGLGNRAPAYSKLIYKDIDPFQFVEDLATSKALVTTAGNQLIGEAFYLGKPVFAFPEDGNKEQEVNGYYINKSGAGLSLPIDKVDSYTMLDFLDNYEEYKKNTLKNSVRGNDRVLETIYRNL